MLTLSFSLSAKTKQLQMGHMVLINSLSSLCQCGAAGSESTEVFATEATLIFTLGGVTIKFLHDNGFPEPLLDRCRNDLHT
ncbi:hypothetical protein DPX16_17425 [Anabarilius grahami]|uniref:Uncharacterized protein n=1 Tax=Anabarilius grahami TaxID=495550 RepID=A0A3N0Y005_ANAGA|nr:hypothetical protein DPX16_17425 [Anabarilius grahami]